MVKYHHALTEFGDLSWDLQPEGHLPANNGLEAYENLCALLTDSCFQTNLLSCNIQVVKQKITLNVCFSAYL